MTDSRIMDPRIKDLVHGFKFCQNFIRFFKFYLILFLSSRGTSQNSSQEEKSKVYIFALSL